MSTQEAHEDWWKRRLDENSRAAAMKEQERSFDLHLEAAEAQLSRLRQEVQAIQQDLQAAQQPPQGLELSSPQRALVAQIHMCQRLLHRAETRGERLVGLALQTLAEQLERELVKSLGLERTGDTCHGAI